MDGAWRRPRAAAWNKMPALLQPRLPNPAFGNTHRIWYRDRGRGHMDLAPGALLEFCMDGLLIVQNTLNLGAIGSLSGRDGSGGRASHTRVRRIWKSPLIGHFPHDDGARLALPSGIAPSQKRLAITAIHQVASVGASATSYRLA